MVDLRHIIERGLGPGTFGSRSYDPWGNFAERKSGLLVPFRFARRREWPTAVDLFSGAGGFSCGLIQAGFQVVGCLDNDVTCMLTYLCNLGSPKTRVVFLELADEVRWEKIIKEEIKRCEKEIRQAKRKTAGVEYVKMEIERLKDRAWGWGWRLGDPSGPPAVEVAIIGDARRLTGGYFLELLDMELGDLDCVVGGPPCQGFSISGKRQVMDPRNSLVFEWARLVVEMKSKTCVMENVPGIVNMVTPEGFPVMDMIAKILEDGGIGPADALRKMLEQTSGVGAVINSKGKPAKVGEHKHGKPGLVLQSRKL